MTARSNRTIQTPTLPTWHVATSDTVRAILANAYATDEPPTTIGDVTLMPHQRDALARVRTTIREFHGALLADEVGLGKTYVALALAHDYQHTHVVAPAALLPMWRAAIARAAVPQIELHSLHAFSRSPVVPDAHASDRSPPHTRNTLVIIDEAHHLRTRNTRRYRAIADFVSGRDVLLLSATPLHNAARELRHLLALFAGLRDDILDPESLARLIVRQTTTSPAPGSARARSEELPRVHEHHPLRIPHDRATLDGILALPSPLPARDGAVAGALIRLGLLRAWCSSDAALTHVIQRRLLRGEALKQALIAGRHPTQAELRTWLVGEHEVQLAFPELLVAHPAESGPLLDVLTRHLDALDALLDHQRRHRLGDAARATALREIVANHPGTPVIAFSQFTRTVQSLYRALSDIAGVGALTGMHAHIASGRIARLDAISRFAPTAQGRPPPPPHQALRLLLATDILAEGVNLQDAGVVVHLDLPWTDALRHQRVGRVARIGSPYSVVHLYSFAPHPAGDRALELTSRLLAKSHLASTLVGHPKIQTPHPLHPTPSRLRRNTPNANSQLDTAPIAPADLATRLHATFHHWRAASSRTANPLPAASAECSVRNSIPVAQHSARNSLAVAQHSARHSIPVAQHSARHSIPVAQLTATRLGWIAAVSTPTGAQLIAHTSRTSTEPAQLWQLLSSIREPACEIGHQDSDHLLRADAYQRDRDIDRAPSGRCDPEPDRVGARAFDRPDAGVIHHEDGPTAPRRSASHFITPCGSLLRARYVHAALRRLRQFLADREITSVVGPSLGTASRAQTLARRRLAELITAAPPLARRSLSKAISTAEELIGSASGIGAESALDAWSRLAVGPSRSDAAALCTPAERLEEWLEGWRSYEVLRRIRVVARVGVDASELRAASHSTHAPRILALLLFRTPSR